MITSGIINFSEIQWTTSAPGERSRVIEQGGRRFRMVELQRDSYSPEVCMVGHDGSVIEGTIRIEFDDGEILVEAGDSFEISDGRPHTPHPVSESVTLFLSEKI